MGCRKEGSYEQHINRKPRRAAHEAEYKHRDDAVFRVFERSGGHIGRYRTTESANQRDESLSLQAELFHETVQQKSGPGHVTRLLQKVYAQKKDQYIGKEHYHRTDRRDYAVSEYGLNRTSGEYCFYSIRYLCKGGIDPVHRNRADFECYLEKEPHEK